MILADGVMGQAMEPVVPDLPDAGPRARAAGSSPGPTVDRPGSSARSTSSRRISRRTTGHLQAKFAAIARARGPLGRRAPRGRRDRRSSPTAPRRASRGRRIERARDQGLRAGLFRPISLWPFPSRAAWRTIAPEVRAIVVVEMSAGQMVEDVRLAVEGRTPVFFHGRTGGMVPTPGEVVDALSRAWALTAPRPQRTVIAWRPLTTPIRDGVIYRRPDAAGRHGRRTTAPAAVTASSTASSRSCWTRCISVPTTIGVASVGCSVFAYDYLASTSSRRPHGRAPAVATGVRRVRPDAFVFTYQGDGDLAAIGTAEIVHAAARGERISVIFVNNGIYGMTGGQMAPTTLLGQRTTSSPGGREASTAGYPIPITEMLALLPGVSYAARGSIADPQSIGRTKRCCDARSRIQLSGGGLSIVEILSTCPVGWEMTPTEAMEHLAHDVVADVSARRPRRPDARTAAAPGRD